MSTFRTKTSWVVITGAASSGKTSVVDALGEKGFDTSPEVARAVIADWMQQGRPLSEIRADPLGLQREILRRSFAREEALDPGRRTFLDRGMPGAFGYWRLGGGVPQETLAAARVFRYRAVFIMERLPFVEDEVRNDGDVADALDRMMDEDYKSLGYDPVRVPVMPVADRVDFILTYLETH